MIRHRSPLSSRSSTSAWTSLLGAMAAAARRSGTRTWGWLALVGLLALAAPVVLAPSALADNVGNTGSTGSEGGGDEGIGSLPSMAGGPGMFVPGSTSAGAPLASGLAKLDGGAPNLWIEGPAELVVSSIDGAWGNGYVTFQLDRAGRVRLYFHGDVRVALAAPAFESGLLSSGVWLSPAYQGGIAAIEWNGNWTAPTVVSGELGLPISAAAHSGVFRSGAVNLHLGSLQTRKHTTIGVAVVRGLVVLSQNVP